MTTEAFFQESGKNSKRAHPLRMRQIWRITCLLQCFSVKFEMWSGPGALLDFSLRMVSWTSPGEKNMYFR
jgi:hypothetical protein